MTDTYISLELAKLAYQRGFNIPQEKGIYLYEGREIEQWMDCVSECVESEPFLGYLCTQSLLQK